MREKTGSTVTLANNHQEGQTEQALNEVFEPFFLQLFLK